MPITLVPMQGSSFLGADGSFEPGLWGVSIAWIGASTVLGLIVAMSGGFACSKVGATDKSVAILIGLVIVVGVLTALGATPATAARPADVSMFDAMTSARSPTWIVWLNPVFGVIGVLLGAKLATTESD